MASAIDKEMKMKKILAIVAVMAMAGAASAASFVWSSGSYGLVNSAGLPSTDTLGGTISLVYLGNGGAADWEGASLVTWGTSGVDGVFAKQKSGTQRVNNTFVFNQAAGDVANGQWYGVAFVDVAGTFGTANQIYQLQYQASGLAVDTAYQIAGLADNSWAGTPFNYAPGGNFQIVPEPTSMALLALGVAALGLRRKFRK
jgi:hypothetical protein